ncbi:hypothetical protein CcaverHIS002_0500180 [Cutaneotrichosporon cavernicola]|nr:hypothetical protein CcaverHIS002_0500180 [Cutaneotrichosporon cavernicola]
MPDSMDAAPASPDLRFETVPSNTPHAQVAQRAYFAEMDARFNEGFDVSLYSGKDSGTVTPAEEEEDEFTFPPAAHSSSPTSPTCQKPQRAAPCAFSSPVSPRSSGSTRLLVHLEAQCVALGAHTIRLDTKDVLTEAIAMYKKYGYYEVPRYNDNPYATHFFEKKVAA